MCQEVSEVLGTTKNKFLIFFHVPVLCHKDIQKCKHAGYVKNIFCPPTTFCGSMGGWNTCLSQVSLFSKVNICVECLSKSVTELTYFYSKSLIYFGIGEHRRSLCIFAITLYTTMCSPGQYSSEHLEFR